MEDKRIRQLLERVTNFNWETPQRSPSRAEFDLHLKGVREFRRTLRRDFPEWHYSDGPHVEQFVGRDGTRQNAIQPELRRVWELASVGEAETAKRKLRKLSERFMVEAERTLATTASWYSLEKHEMKTVPRNPRPNDATRLRQMVETLEWLQGRLRSLKVCENPKCATARRYFFKLFNNDRYCCSRCASMAKTLRQAKRDAESQKPRKVPTKPAETRKKMSIAQTKRWEEHRAKTGKPKYARS